MTATVAGVDPITFEVLRHRLSMIVDEAGQVLRETSGSPVASEVGDCNAALMDAQGNAVVIGPLLPSHAFGCAAAVRYVVQSYQENPGIKLGDMFISNDPYRATPHQSCVVVVAPIFVDDQLVAWSGAGIHLADVGGPIPGQIAVGAQSIYEEPCPMPPIKLVDAGVVRQDIQEDWLVRSRTRQANALDLRAKIASNLALERSFREMVDRYDVETVKGVMARTIEFVAETIRERLCGIPDGTWAAQTFLDYDDQGDVALYRCSLQLSKVGDHLTLDFRGSAAQAPGVVNCSYSGLESAVVNALLYALAWNLPSCPAGVMKTFDIVREPGSFIDAEWPAGMTKATTSAMQCVRDTVTQAMSRMFASCPELAGRVTAPWAGYSGVMEIAGLDQRGHPFATPLLDFSMASGGGAFPTRDGIHTCGSIGSPGMSMANAEVYEQRYPLLILARREEMDTAGAGRFEGGSALCVMATPHDTDRIPDIIFHTHGMHAPSTVGLHGGLPGSTFRCVVKRETDVQSVLARGRIPRHLADLAGEIEVLPGISRSYLNKGDVYLVLDNGGGGYGDPLDRSLHLIEDDLRLGYLSPSRAESIYGVAFLPDRRVDEHLTLEQRNDMRRRRLEFVTQTGDGPADTWLRTGQAGQPVTDRIQLVESQGGLSYGCKCGAVLGKADRDYRRYLPHFDAPCTSAGPHCLDLIPEPQVFLRNYVCPSCGSLAEVNLLSAEHGERID